MKALLDTNILLRAAQPSQPQATEIYKSLTILIEAGCQPCLVPQNIYEFWVVATRPVSQNGFGLDSSKATQLANECISKFTLLKDERGIFVKWFSLVEQHSVMGKNAHDARLVAAMKRHDISCLITFNKSDFSRFSFVTALAPQDILDGALPRN